MSKILYTKVSDRMAYANSADLDQTAPEEAVSSDSTLFAIPLTILRNSCIKKQNLGQEIMKLTLILLNLDISCLCKQCRSRSVGF